MIALTGDAAPLLHARINPREEPGPAPCPDMVWVPGGVFHMGSNIAYPEEAPQHLAEVPGFWMDRFPVTNARFSAFVAATGHTTRAEVPPEARQDRRGRRPALRPASMVFIRPDRRLSRQEARHWWRQVIGADWRHPLGPASTLEGLEQHPVVHVAYADALAFAAWDRKQIPTEAEWEFAARGGLDGATYAWGDVLMPEGRPMANYWQGRFPYENTCQDGWERTSPVGSFPPNGYGLYDMIGNVWEWTTSCYQPRHDMSCEDTSAGGGAERRVVEPSLAPRVLKGGSHLCDLNHCHRYRPSARFPKAVSSTGSNVGFRCIVRA